MRAEDIIEGLNKHIETVRRDKEISAKGHIVLHKEITPHSSFKAYKIFTYTLWFINDKKSYRLLTLQQNARVIESQEENMIREMNIMFSTMLFNWIGTSEYNEVIKGEYGVLQK